MWPIVHTATSASPTTSPSDSSSRLRRPNLCPAALPGTCWKISGPRWTSQNWTTGDTTLYAVQGAQKGITRYRRIQTCTACGSCCRADSKQYCTFSIMGNLTLFTQQDPETTYPSQDTVWFKFEQTFRAVWGLVTYAPVFRDYYYQGLSQLYLDNVMYLELRALLPEVT